MKPTFNLTTIDRIITEYGERRRVPYLKNMDESREPVRNDNEVMCVRFTPHPLYLNSSKQYGRDYRINC